MFDLLSLVWFVFASVFIIWTDQIALPFVTAITGMLSNAVFAVGGVFFLKLIFTFVHSDEPLPKFFSMWVMLVTPFALNDWYIVALSAWPQVLAWSIVIKTASIALTGIVAYCVSFEQKWMIHSRKGT